LNKRKRRSVTRNRREEHRAGSDGAIVIGTCLRAEHVKKKKKAYAMLSRIDCS